MYKAMQLANLWRSNPQGCEYFGITGDLVKREYDLANGIRLEYVSYPERKPYPMRARMQDMARRFGSMSMHRKPCRDDMKYKSLPCSCDIPQIGLISIVDAEVWNIPEYV